MKDKETAIAPEKLYKEKKLILSCFVVFVIMFICMFLKIPALDAFLGKLIIKI